MKKVRLGKQNPKTMPGFLRKPPRSMSPKSKLSPGGTFCPFLTGMQLNQEPLNQITHVNQLLLILRMTLLFNKHLVYLSRIEVTLILDCMSSINRLNLYLAVYNGDYLIRNTKLEGKWWWHMWRAMAFCLGCLGQAGFQYQVVLRLFSFQNCCQSVFTACRAFSNNR